MTLAELRARAGAELLAPQRVDFHCLVMVQSGQGKHMIDFVEHRLKPGTVLLVKAGQVQQWHMHAGLQGRLLLASIRHCYGSMNGRQRRCWTARCGSECWSIQLACAQILRLFKGATPRRHSSAILLPRCCCA